MSFINTIANVEEFERFFFRNDKKLVLFGASNAAKVFLEYLEKNDLEEEIKVSCVVDNDNQKAGTVFWKEIKIIDIETFKNNKDKMKVLITNRYLFQTLETLRYLGMKWDEGEEDIYFPKHMDYLLGKRISNDFTLNKYYTKQFAIIKHAEEIEEVYNMLEDARSKEVLKNWIKYRFEFKQEYMNVTNRGEKIYFDKEFLELSEDESFVDIGALEGDSCIDFIISAKFKYKHIYVVEPETEGIKKCFDTLFNPITKDKITFYNFGISSQNEIVSYRNNNGEWKYIKAWTIDTIFSDKEVTLIKMDIEGMEEKALLGAEIVIKKQKPKLAICIYHLEDDIYRIPLLIRKMNPNYKFYIRHNEDHDGEVVLYAV